MDSTKLFLSATMLFFGNLSVNVLIIVGERFKINFWLIPFILFPLIYITNILIPKGFGIGLETKTPYATLWVMNMALALVCSYLFEIFYFGKTLDWRIIAAGILLALAGLILFSK